MSGYQSPEVCVLTGATFRQLDHWTRKGYIIPSVRVSVGSGHNRLWSFDDAVQIAVLVQLCAAGVAPTVAAAKFDINASTIYRATHVKNVCISVDVHRIREALKAKLPVTEEAAA